MCFVPKSDEKYSLWSGEWGWDSKSDEWNPYCEKHHSFILGNCESLNTSDDFSHNKC